MVFNVISSGSKGNATIVVHEGHCILLDFGISKKRVETALAEYGLGFDDIEAVFITHAHSDHASNAYSAPLEKVYTSQLSLPKINHVFSGCNLLHPYQNVDIGCFTITPLPLSHDCDNTVGFVIKAGDESLAYITDTGFVPEKDFTYLMGLNYYIFESNHDPKMLYESKRPDYLIRRIISDKGHLSNQDCGYYLSNFITSNTKEVILAHLSEECNTPEVAKETVEMVLQTQLGYLPDVLLKTSSAEVETKGGRL
jgi:phosphoribosyl 1,2-cyclic phosphodiesterase